MSNIKPSNFIKLKELVNTDRVATDDWRATEYDALHDLGFEIDDIYNMDFEHEERVNGKDKFISIRVHRLEDIWIMEIKKKRDGQFIKREYKDFKTLMKVIHEMFKKF